MADLQEKERHMSLLEWIDYGLIILFFVVAAGLVMVVAGPPRKDVAVSDTLPPVRQNKMAYALLAVLCLLLLCMALLSDNRPDTR